jgi:hypothetical protein
MVDSGRRRFLDEFRCRRRACDAPQGAPADDRESGNDNRDGRDAARDRDAPADRAARAVTRLDRSSSSWISAVPLRGRRGW